MTNDLLTYLRRVRDVGFDNVPMGEREMAIKSLAEIERLHKALHDASYALFQLKRMVPEAVPEFARKASDKAMAALDEDADEPAEVERLRAALESLQTRLAADRGIVLRSELIELCERALSSVGS